MPDSPIGPDLGPSPAGDGVPAFDSTHEWVCESPGGKPLNVRLGIVYVRDPRHAEELRRQQAEAIFALLAWIRDVKAGIRCPGQKTSPSHCGQCQDAEPWQGGHCPRGVAECPCAPFHLPET